MSLMPAWPGGRLLSFSAGSRAIESRLATGWNISYCYTEAGAVFSSRLKYKKPIYAPCAHEKKRKNVCWCMHLRTRRVPLAACESCAASNKKHLKWWVGLRERCRCCTVGVFVFTSTGPWTMKLIFAFEAVSGRAALSPILATHRCIGEGPRNYSFFFSHEPRHYH